MKISSLDKSELMVIGTIERKGNALVVRGRILGAMPMAAVITPEEARKGLKLLNVRLILFLVTFLFRSNA
jgi:hypothetical protein